MLEKQAMPKIYIAGDHAAFALKGELIPYIAGLGYEVEDCGAFTLDTSDDYPDYILPCARKVSEDSGSMGIIIGASGQGEAMAANTVPGARAAVYYGEPAKPQTDMDGKELSMIASVRNHNHANILSLGARFIALDEAKQAIKAFLETPVSTEERHLRRVQKY